MNSIEGKTYIVILNWNGWADTIECLQSVFNLNREYKFHVVICDNGSQDDSIIHIKQWLTGLLCSISFLNTQEYDRTKIIENPPISFNEVPPDKAENEFKLSSRNNCTLIPIGKNIGFAGGCNVGIRFSLNQEDCEYVWLLNNDTVVTRDALKHLVNQINISNKYGVCGSTLIYYESPKTIQALGGARYYPCIGLSRHIFGHRVFNRKNVSTAKTSRMSYVVGASFLIRADVIKEVGLLNEEYFLYCEEIDYCERLKGRFKLTHAKNSLVYHKEGASIGGSSIRKNKSDTSIYYAVKSKLLFTKNYYKLCLPTVYFVIIVRFIFLLIRLNFRQSGLILKILFGQKHVFKKH